MSRDIKRKQADSPLLPGQQGEDFSEEREILTYRPRIEYEEPPQIIPPEEDSDPEPQAKEELEDRRNRTEQLAQGFRAAAKLADRIQAKIDNIVGDYAVTLDPDLDATVVDAIRRKFPNKKDPTNLTYKEYKDIVQNMKGSGAQITEDDIRKARTNPERTDIGQSSRQDEAQHNPIKPLDQKQFQDNAVSALFNLMAPLIQAAITAAIVAHTASTPHY